MRLNSAPSIILSITLSAISLAAFATPAKNDWQRGKITIENGESLRLSFRFNKGNVTGDFKIFQGTNDCQRFYWITQKMEFGGGKTGKPSTNYLNGCIHFYTTRPAVWGQRMPWGDIRYYVMPNFHGNALYNYDQIVRDLPIWEKEFDKVDNHQFNLEFRYDAASNWTYCFFDGQFIGHLKWTGPAKRVEYNLKDGTDFSYEKFNWARDNTGYTLPALQARSAQYLRENAKLTIDDNSKDAVRLIDVWEPAKSIDQSKHAETSTMYGFGNAPKYLRTPFATGPEYFQWMVPRNFYLYADVLCANIPQDGMKPILGCSMTRFGGAVNRLSFATGFTDLSTAATNRNVRKVGKLEYVKDGKKTETPLYLVRQKLNIGQITHIMHDRPIFSTNEVTGASGRLTRVYYSISDYLDFEFVGGGSGANKPKSSVHVFGARLIPAPYSFDIVESERGNVFENDEKPETGIEIAAYENNVKGKVEWTISDTDFNVLKRGSTDFRLTKQGEKALLKFDLSMPEVGWYQLDYRFLDENGNELMKHHAAFTLLGRNDREAGFESPYACWPQGTGYGTYRDHPEMGFWMLGRAGSNPFRREVVKNMHKLGYHSAWATPVKDEWEFPEYQITQSALSKFCNGTYWPMSLKFKPEDAPAISNRIEKAVEWYKEEITRYPHCKTIQLLHEQGGKLMSKECAGEIPAVRGEYKGIDGYFQTYWCTELAKRMRKEFPGYHLQVGNGSSSVEKIAELCRTGFDLSLVDTLGIESKGFGTAPEESNHLEAPGMFWALKETAQLFGYSNMLMNACNEYVFRAERPADVTKERSPRDRMRVTDFTIRDYLISLAHGCWTISTGHLEDCDGDYYETAWGAAGQATFYPFSYPKRMYTALANFTKVFDKASYSRVFDTGANCTYALEFKRDRKVKDYAYAYWTACFPCGIEAKFPKNARITAIDWQGRKKILNEGSGMKNGVLSLTASSTPAYLISDVPAESITYVKSVREPVNGEMTILCDPLHPAFAKQKRPGLQHGDKITKMPGNTSKGGWYTLEEVDDPEWNRKVMKLMLDKTQPVPNKFIREGCVLWYDKEREFNLNDYDEIGIWIKGNGGWGNVYISLTGPNGNLNNLQPCPYRGYANFDGWQLVKCNVRNKFNDGKEHKMRVRSLGFSTARNALNPVEMVPVVNDLVIGPVVGIKYNDSHHAPTAAENIDWAMKMVDEKDL